MSRQNNFNIIRLVAAFMVLFSHSWALSGRENNEPLVMLTDGLIGFGSLGVLIFFSISGFLVAQSYDYHRNSWFFIKARALRIFPALFFSSLMTVLVIVPLTLPDGDVWVFWLNPETWHYVWGNTGWQHIQTLNGIFETTPFPKAVNGSLWTLKYELFMYGVIWGLGLLGVLARPIALAFVSLLALVAWLVLPSDVLLNSVFWNLGLYSLVVAFITGSLMWRLSNYWLAVMDKPWAGLRVPVLIAMMVLLGFLWPSSAVAYISWLVALSMTVIFVALYPKWYCARLNWKVDYSYGLYLFAFPVQQSLMVFWPSMSIWLYIASAFVISLGFAALSWHWIEQPALALKKYIW